MEQATLSVKPVDQNLQDYSFSRRLRTFGALGAACLTLLSGCDSGNQLGPSTLGDIERDHGTPGPTKTMVVPVNMPTARRADLQPITETALTLQSDVDAFSVALHQYASYHGVPESIRNKFKLKVDAAYAQFRNSFTNQNLSPIEHGLIAGTAEQLKVVQGLANAGRLTARRGDSILDNTVDGNAEHLYLLSGKLDTLLWTFQSNK